MKGEIDPRVSTLERIASGLGMSLVELLGKSSFEAQEVVAPAQPPPRGPMVLELKLNLPPGADLPEALRDMPWEAVSPRTVARRRK